eukprot:2050990-Pyramimonas_sp.AAC.1
MIPFHPRQPLIDPPRPIFCRPYYARARFHCSHMFKRPCQLHGRNARAANFQQPVFALGKKCETERPDLI